MAGHQQDLPSLNILSQPSGWILAEPGVGPGQSRLKHGSMAFEINKQALFFAVREMVNSGDCLVKKKMVLEKDLS